MIRFMIIIRNIDSFCNINYRIFQPKYPVPKGNIRLGVLVMISQKFKGVAEAGLNFVNQR